MKKLVWSGVIFFAGILAAVFIGLPLLARLAVGLSLIRKDTNTVNESTNFSVFAPIIEPLPNATNSAMLQVSGISDKDRQINLSVNNEKTGETVTDDEGKFKFRGISLKDGANTISVTAKYKDQESLPASFSIVFKKDPPRLEINSPSDGQTITGNADIYIEGVTDPDTRLSLNERLAIVDRNGNFRYQVKLNEGENSFKFKAEDEAGNSKESELKVRYSP